MKIISLLTLTVIGLSLTLRAQVPTIDVSSLQQLYQQYQTMQQQYATAQKISSTASAIYNQDVKTYTTSLGNVDKITGNFSKWIQTFSTWKPTNTFNGTAAPIQSFTNNVKYWANQTAFGGNDVRTMEQRWQDTVLRVSAGTATDWEKRLAIGGYNSKIIESAGKSMSYSSNVLKQSSNVLANVKAGTLIEQAGAQNALIYHQTALLDKMKGDINDSAVAEAAHREAQLQAEHERAIIRKAISNIDVQ
jgi:hypothetical protein